MALWSIVSRVSDGLPLCESTDPIPVTGAETQKTQAKLILKRLDSRSPARLSVESGTFLYSYAVDDGIVVLVITDARYPKRLIFGFLRDAHAEFSSYVREAHGESWRSVISATGQAYAFLGFAKILSRLRRDYADTDSKANANRLAGELFDVQSIMRQNIAEVLDRGERLDHVSKVSSRLVTESKQFKWSAQKLRLLDRWKQLAPWVIAAVVLLAVLWWRFRK